MPTWSLALKFSFSACLAIVALGISPARADITYLQRSTALSVKGRTADCVVNGCFDTGTIQAGTTTFDAYSNSLSYDAAGLTGFATASQQSSLDSGGIKVQSNVTSNSFSLGAGSSLFSVQFTLDTAENFHFFGQTYNSESPAASSAMMLTGPGVSLSAEFNPFSGAGLDRYNADTSGVLAPGTYTFVVSTLSNGPTSSGSALAAATAELDLTPVPLPDAWVLLLSALAPLALVRSCGGSGRGGSARFGSRANLLFA